MNNVEKAQQVYTLIFDEMRRDLIPSIIHEDFIHHEGFGGGRDKVGLWVADYRLAFSGLRFHVHAASEAPNDEVWTHASFTGRHTGDFYGIPASGKHVVVNMLDRMRFQDGLVIEHWGATDFISLFHQIGVPGAELVRALDATVQQMAPR